MKKLITLLIALGAFVAVHAQTTKEEARRVILGQEKRNGSGSNEGRDVVLGGGNNRNDYPGSYPNNYPTSRQSDVDQVNREYDRKIWSIRNNNSLSAEEKARIIRQLEQDRARKIRQVNQSSGGDYGRKGKRYDNDDDYREKRYGKSNNGKHLGWEKGKGNPHRYGGKPGKGKKD